MPAPRVRSGRILAAAVRQIPAIVVAVLLVGFGYLAALLRSGRTVGTWDVVAAAAAGAVTGLLGVYLVAAMSRAAQTAIDHARARTDTAPPAPPAPTRTGLPVITPAAQLAADAGFPSYDDDPEAAQRAMQERINRARPRPSWAPQ